MKKTTIFPVLLGACLAAIALPASGAMIVYDFDSGPFPLSATSVDLPGASANLALSNPGQEGTNYTIAFSSGNLVINRITGGNPVGDIASNGLNGATGRTIGGSFASLFVLQITAGANDLIFESASWYNDNAASNRLARVAMFDDSFQQIGATVDTPAPLNTPAVLAVDGATHTGGAFDGTIAAGTTRDFYLDTGFNFNSGDGIHALDKLELQLNVIPEPSAMLLFSVGLLPLIRRRR